MLPAVAGSFHYPQTTRNFIARQFHQATLSWDIIRSIIDVQLLVSPPTDDTYSAFRYSFHSDCFCIVLDKWSTSTTKSSSWAKKTPFYWEFSFNAQHTRMGDVCELGTRIQSVMGRDFELPHSIHLMFCADSDIIHVNALGTSMIILNSYQVATDLLDRRSNNYSSR